MSCTPTASAHLPWSTAPTRERLRTLQLNLGRLCNLACTHCHVEAGPKRTEMILGFRQLVLAVRATGAEVIDRCNLAVLQESG